MISLSSQFSMSDFKPGARASLYRNTRLFNHLLYKQVLSVTHVPLNTIILYIVTPTLQNCCAPFTCVVTWSASVRQRFLCSTRIILIFLSTIVQRPFFLFSFNFFPSIFVARMWGSTRTEKKY